MGAAEVVEVQDSAELTETELEVIAERAATRLIVSVCKDVRKTGREE